MSDRVRAVLVTLADRLLMIKRVKPGQCPYWVLPGGGVDPTDSSLEDALHREIREELAGTADIHSLIQVVERGGERQYIFLTRIRTWDFADRSGPEFTETGGGEYILDEIPLTRSGLAGINLVPPEIAEILRREGANVFRMPDLRASVA